MISEKILIKLIVIIECIIYLTFLYIDAFEMHNYQLSTQLKYISIIMCFLITMIVSIKEKSKDLLLLRMGMFITVLADLFLLILYSPAIGVGLFCLVQIIYAIRYNYLHKKQVVKHLVMLGSVITIIYIGIYEMFFEADIIIPLVCFYFICLVVNTIKSILLTLINKNIKYKVIAVGMVLFLLCDINVGIYNITVIGNADISSTLNRFAYVGMWLFYLPSQVLLAISGGLKNIKKYVDVS